MRDAFAVLFFVAVGMLLPPGYLLEAPGLILATLAVVMIGKPLIALVVVRMLGYPFRVALAMLGRARADWRILFHPVEHRHGPRYPAGRSHQHARGRVDRLDCPQSSAVPLVPRVEKWVAGIRVGHGYSIRGSWTATPRVRHDLPIGASGRSSSGTGRPGGRSFAASATTASPTVVELNMETVRHLRQLGIDAVYGDVTQRDTIDAAGTGEAGTLILTSAGMGSASR
jgi:CPA2 family monovalent cation:H+ antiporter-2